LRFNFYFSSRKYHCWQWRWCR